MNEQTIKPWLLLDPNDYESRWWIASKNNYLSYNSINENNQTNYIVDLNKTISAYFIIQDCNMGGEYFRYFFWLGNNAQRYFEVNSKWYFDIPMREMKNGDIVLHSQSQEKFIVNDKFNDKFVKILEKYNE